jgi:uncharacterized cupredoxin-like copper-binding protein
MVANLDPAAGAPSSAPLSQDRAMDRRRLGLWGTLAFAALSVVGMYVQVYLIAGVLFGEDWLELHRDLGKLVHLGYLLTVGAAVVAAAPDWRSLMWPFVLAALGSTQAFLAGEFDIPFLAWGIDIARGNGVLHAFHGALVPIVFAIALGIAWRAWTALGMSEPTLAPTGRGQLIRANRPRSSATRSKEGVAMRTLRRNLLLLLSVAIVATGLPFAVAATAGTAEPSGAEATPSGAEATTTVRARAGEMFFRLSQRTLPRPGRVTFVVTNVGHAPHDFRIDGKKTALIRPHGTARLTVTFRKKGRYPYACTVAGHAAAGMKGVFTVR